ncbi:CHAP domain-containing protein [Nocardia takedensis]
MVAGQVGARRARGWLVAGAALALVLALGGFLGLRWWQQHGEPDAVTGVALTEFPALDRAELDPSQRALVAVLEREFADPRSGPNYAEGVREAWCADFVSWVMREAGLPLSNPNSGSWRIPGVYTLQEYYQGAGRFVPGGGDYRPRTGDVLLYAEGSPFSQHTNIVLEADGGEVTTIGGNEFGTVRIHRFDLTGMSGFVGFGRL